MADSSSSPLVFVPRQGKAQQLFVLLHGEGADPAQVVPLANAIAGTFAQAVVFLPKAFLASPETETGFHWGLPEHWQTPSNPQGVVHTVSQLETQVRKLQQQFGLSGQQTALAGFSHGASLALEAIQASHDLAGRVLAFSGLPALLPPVAPPATLIHFLHGEQDTLVPVEDARFALEHFAAIEGDATLDIASGIGHELHQSLIQQAMVRLTTCVPMRSWKEAMQALGNSSEGSGRLSAIPSGRTLH